MNVFIILSVLVIVVGIILLVASPSVLFKLNWEEKTGKDKFSCLCFMVFGFILISFLDIK